METNWRQKNSIYVYDENLTENVNIWLAWTESCLHYHAFFQFYSISFASLLGFKNLGHKLQTLHFSLQLLKTILFYGFHLLPSSVLALTNARGPTPTLV